MVTEEKFETGDEIDALFTELNKIKGRKSFLSECFSGHFLRLRSTVTVGVARHDLEVNLNFDSGPTIDVVSSIDASPSLKLLTM